MAKPCTIHEQVSVYFLILKLRMCYKRSLLHANQGIGNQKSRLTSDERKDYAWHNTAKTANPIYAGQASYTIFAHQKFSKIQTTKFTP